MTHPNFSGPEWQKVRRLVLTRDGGVFQIKGAKCRHRATEVDHIVNVADRGARLDPANLRAACTSCNVSKRNTEVAARTRLARGLVDTSTPEPWPVYSHGENVNLDGYNGQMWAWVALVAGWAALVTCSAGLVFAVWPRGYALAVTDPGEVSAESTTRSMTATVRGQIDANRHGIQGLWVAVRVSIVTLVINALSWGALAVWSPT